MVNAINNREIELLSLLFDSDWYLRTYKDVAESNSDPLHHYLVFGYREGRNPNRYFNTNFYLIAYPDVVEANINPFIHYILYGASEGRLPRPEGQEPLPITTTEKILPQAPASFAAYPFPTQPENSMDITTAEENKQEISQKKTSTKPTTKAKKKKISAAVQKETIEPTQTEAIIKETHHKPKKVMKKSISSIKSKAQNKKTTL